MDENPYRAPQEKQTIVRGRWSRARTIAIVLWLAFVLGLIGVLLNPPGS
jgi:hypothetical protein